MCGRFGHGEMSSVSIWVQGQSYIAEEEAVYCLCRGIPDKGVLKPSQRQAGLGFDFDLDFVSTSAYVYVQAIADSLTNRDNVRCQLMVWKSVERSGDVEPLRLRIDAMSLRLVAHP
jgi:hypothetical protein